jgi:hypothetical protein
VVHERCGYRGYILPSAAAGTAAGLQAGRLRSEAPLLFVIINFSYGFLPSVTYLSHRSMRCITAVE